MTDQIQEREVRERHYTKLKIYCAFCGAHLLETEHYKKDGGYHKPACELCAGDKNSLEDNGKVCRVSGQKENPFFDGLWSNLSW